MFFFQSRLMAIEQLLTLDFDYTSQEFDDLLCFNLKCEITLKLELSALNQCTKLEEPLEKINYQGKLNKKH